MTWIETYLKPSQAFDEAKRKIYEAQNWRCAYCGIVMPYAPRSYVGDDRPTREHYRPKSLGGTDAWENLAGACALCNSGRGIMHPEVYFVLVQRVGRYEAERLARERVNHLDVERQAIALVAARVAVTAAMQAVASRKTARVTREHFEEHLEAALIERNGGTT
jgi:hypothetical protein